MEDYDDGPSPFRMFGILGMVAPMVVTMLMAGMLWMGLLYVIARWRNNRAAVPDPQLGLKFALHLFRFHGYQLMLLGGFLLLFTVLLKKGEYGPTRGDMARPAFAFLVAGGLVYGAHTLGLAKTNQAQHPLVGRLFGGLNLIVTGLVGFIGLVFALQILFAKGEGGNEARAAWSAVLVYCVAWGVQGALLGKSMLDGDAPPPEVGAAPGSPIVPPTAPVPEPMRQPLA